MSSFVQQLQSRVLVFDGAMGTMVHALELDLERDYLGKENCPEVLILSRPDAIRSIHEAYLAQGADGVKTNTFGANKLVLAEFDLTDKCFEINKRAVEIAREACKNIAARPDQAHKPHRFVLGSMGPGTRLITLGNTNWDQMFDSYLDQARGLLAGGVDAFLIETCQDVLQAKCAVNACTAALAEKGLLPASSSPPRGETERGASSSIPIMVQVTVETTGTMLLGSSIAAAATILEPLPVFSLGLNFATGPVEMREHIRWLSEHWPRVITVQPNAGLPVLLDGKPDYPLKPQAFVESLVRFIDEFGVNLVGGCCGTTPAHIAQLVKTVGTRTPAPRSVSNPDGTCASLYEPTDFRQDLSLLNIGERCNASGSRAFKKLLEAEDWDAMVSLAREQMAEGSHVLDVNVDYAGRDNASDMAQIVRRFVRQVNAPLMLDSTQPATIEAGLKCAAGKCIINSTNLEEGEEKFAHMLRLARTYGSAIVLGTIDEDKEEAMARTRDRKIAIAGRMFHLAVEKYHLDPRDIFFDPLVLPISTGMEKDRKSALETIEGVRLIAREFPAAQITCGLSNVSFGLKPVARVVLNSDFLHELQNAGLTSAILHASKILPQNKIPEAQWHAAQELIYDRRSPGIDPLQKFIALFPDEAATAGAGRSSTSLLGGGREGELLSIEDRLRKHIIDGEKRNLVESLETARQTYTALQIINDHLLDGMKTVGELFGSGKMQLPFVLQSAEVMKTAVNHLQQYMEKSAGPTKGSIVLATVKGDVHDIGKNLVDIILSNNGYTVHNLGIKQPLSAILEKWRETSADAIGMSGLLVKSVTVMKENLEELVRLGVTAPILLGGAALSRHYCESELRAIYRARGGGLFYGRDAFEGLAIMDHLRAGKINALDQEIEARLVKRADVETRLASKSAATADAAPAPKAQPSPVNRNISLPVAPFLGARIVEHIKPQDIYPYINKIALYRGQWQFKKGARSDAEYQAQIENEVEPIFNRLSTMCIEDAILQPRVVYGFFPCNSDGNDLIVFSPVDPAREVERFTFPRQNGKQNRCISDFFLPMESGRRDVLGLHCVTVGHEVSNRARKLFEANEYAEYLYLHGFGVESAEALAELWHKRMRQELGIGTEDSPHIRELFTQHYRGSRYSFGYPACPEMSDQEKLFRLLNPQRIGCTLTENWQIDPEQSTSALIVHHPDAKYFAI